MNPVKHTLYETIIRLHPAEFREDFGREMLLDFEAVAVDTPFRTLLGDALLSLARQWLLVTTSAVSPAPAQTQAAGAKGLLAGRYVTASQGLPSMFDLARGSVVSTILLLAIAFAATMPNRRLDQALEHSRTASTSVAAAADSQTRGTAKGSGSVSALGLQRPGWDLRVGRPLPAAAAEVSGVAQYLILIPPAFLFYLLKVLLFALAGWIASSMVIGKPRSAKRIASAALVLLAVAVPLAYSALHMKDARPMVSGQSVAIPSSSHR